MTVVARLSPVLDARGVPFSRETPGGSTRIVPRIDWRRTLARYDLAQTTDDNMRHWAYTDSLSPDASNSPGVRQIMRNRSRYETANNSYCRSIVETLANDTIGTGPRVQIATGAGKEADQFLEREIGWWMYHTAIARKFRVMRKAKAQDGEGIGLLVTRPKLPTPVKLSLRTLETEQLATPYLSGTETNAVDGIRFDTDGEPIEYDVLPYHPGGFSTAWLQFGRPDVVPASELLHVFRLDRPGQHRGIPELLPALPIFSQLRRFTLATLAAAETAAEFAAVIHTAQATAGNYSPSVSAGNPWAPEAMDTFELAQRMVTVLPDGYSLDQIKPEHPATTFGEFKREMLAEAFAAVVMPYAVGANDSKDYNFASGKLDRRGYAKAIAIERTFDWSPLVFRLVYSWYLEARLIAGYLPATPPFSAWTVQTFWDEVEDDIDPVKASSARATELETGQVSRRTMLARRGVDYDVEEERIAAEKGLSVEEYRRRLGDKELGRAGNSSPQRATTALEAGNG
jgi:capsid protein